MLVYQEILNRLKAIQGGLLWKATVSNDVVIFDHGFGFTYTVGSEKLSVLETLTGKTREDEIEFLSDEILTAFWAWSKPS